MIIRVMIMFVNNNKEYFKLYESKLGIQYQSVKMRFGDCYVYNRDIWNNFKEQGCIL